jgi:hypothetical protein
MAHTKSHARNDDNARAHMDAIAEGATQIVDESRDLLSETVENLDIPGRMARHPYQTMLIAAGIGYVLGGGLLTPLTARLLRTGIRVAALPLLRQEFMGAVAPLLEREREPETV